MEGVVVNSLVNNFLAWLPQASETAQPLCAAFTWPSSVSFLPYLNSLTFLLVTSLFLSCLPTAILKKPCMWVFQRVLAVHLF